jgi:outer membrane protein OmpA-like peptidoglycan-associated protein
MNLRKALLAATVLALPAAATAQPISGLYVGAGAGMNYRQASTVTTAGVAVGTLRSSVGYAAVASIGWGFGNGIRAELEGSYRFNEQRITGVFGGGNYIRQYGLMGNALYDFDLSGFGISPRTFMPYLGAGVGYVWTGVDQAGGGANLRTRGRLGYQAIVGGAFGLGDFVPGLALTAEYRYMGTMRTNVSPVAGGFAFSNNNHSAMLGLRYAFNAPRPAVVAPPVAPQVQQVARTYLVFFDWNRADLTDRARQIIGEAAAARTSVRSTRIEVSGHADRSGTPQYNQALSMRRAEAVAAELARRGVPRNEMVIQAFGESRPLVPTADNVREPQNRRVEIVLR